MNKCVCVLVSGSDPGKFMERINFKDIERGEILGKGSFGTVFRFVQI